MYKHTPLSLVLTFACTESKDIEEATIAFCDGSTQVRYDPLNSDELIAFPDDWYTVVDESSPTGIRVDLSVEKAPWTQNIAPIFTPAIEDTSTRSGFARLGGAVIRFTQPIQYTDIGADESLVHEGIQWLDLSVSPPERVAYTTSVSDDLRQIIVKPVKPLRGGAQHAILITNEYKDVDNNCIAPAPLMQKLLSNSASDSFVGHGQKLQQTLDVIGIDPSVVSHLLTFTTHDDLGMFRDVATNIESNTYEWSVPLTCTEDNCQGEFLSYDYREDGAIASTEPVDAWSIPVFGWLPTDFEPPYPTVIYGHGLNTRAQTASRVADIVNPLGFAVFSIDALHHGQHPTANPDSTLPALTFLGLNLSEVVFDSKALRGNFDQSAADRLQLIQLLKQHPDVNGDGIIDIDTEHMVYYGISLGGLMGSQLMANSPFKAGILAEGGGDLPVFTTDTTTVDVLDDLLEFLVGPPEVFDRLLPVFQTAVDSADPAIWATHVLQNRLDDAQIPDVLFPVCVEDDTVPPATAKALAHGLDIPHLAPVLDPVDMLDVQEGPLKANLPSGATGAYFQFDRVTINGTVVPADHGNLPNSPEAIWMIQHFLNTHLNGQTEIVEPYGELRTPPLQ